MGTNKGSRTFIAIVLGMLAAGCGGNKVIPPACTPAAAKQFAYLLNSNGTQVSMFSIDSCTGAFTATTPATVATGVSPGQLGAEDMVVDPLGRFAYVADLVSNASDQATISMFTINPATGVLSPTNPATIHTGFFPQGIVIDPAGKFVYTANSDDNTVSMFTVDAATGLLTPTTTPAIAAGNSPGFVTIDPSGRFAYAANQIDGTISMYAINSSTGVLSPLSPATVIAGGGPFGVAFDPSGKFAYVPDNDVNMVSQFKVDPNTGVLNPITPSSVATGQSPTAVAVDPSGKFAYVVNRIDNTVSMFTIDSATGSLSPHGVIGTGTQPFRIAFDRSGKFLYVVNEQGLNSVYTINSDGTLKSAGMTGNANGALSLAITMARQ
ncbi:MAG TPA: beta-propeller fold lactonase family protein [Candidatus Angelobacter sp.]